MSKEAMKLALGALEKADRHCPVNTEAEVFVRLSITALREALAEQDDPDLQDKDPEFVEQHYKQVVEGVRKVFDAKRKQSAQQEPVTLMNNLALTIASDALDYRELVWKLSEKVMGVAMSSEPVEGKANRVQVTAEAMSDLRRFVEKGVTERLAFNDKLFDTHKAAAWKLNTTPQPAQQEAVCDKDPQGCWNVRCQLGKKCKNTPAQQEPAGEIGKVVMFGGDLKEVSWKNGKMPPVGSVLYTSPPAQRKPLTEEQIDAAVKAWFENDIVAGRNPFGKRMRAAIEAAHGIKENT